MRLSWCIFNTSLKQLKKKEKCRKKTPYPGWVSNGWTVYLVKYCIYFVFDMLHVIKVGYFVKLMLGIDHLYATMFSLAFYVILACCWVKFYGNLRVKFTTYFKNCISFMDIMVSILNFWMSIFITSNMPTIVLITHLDKYLHLKLVWVICQSLLWISSLIKILQWWT